MKDIRIIELNEEDIKEMISIHLKNHVDSGIMEEEVELKFITGVKGNYDDGTARNYIKKIICTIESEV